LIAINILLLILSLRKVIPLILLLLTTFLLVNINLIDIN